MKKIYLLFALLASVLVGCEGPAEDVALDIVSSETEYSFAGGTGKVMLNKTVAESEISSSEKWLTFSVEGKEITVKVAHNPNEARDAVLTIGTGDSAKDVTINQSAMTYEDNLGDWKLPVVTYLDGFYTVKFEDKDIQLKKKVEGESYTLTGVFDEEIEIAANGNTLSVDFPVKLADRTKDGVTYKAYLCAARISGGVAICSTQDMTLSATAKANTYQGNTRLNYTFTSGAGTFGAFGVFLFESDDLTADPKDNDGIAKFSIFKDL